MRAAGPTSAARATYLGSAARFPHVQGGFARHLVVRADQLVPLPDGLDMRRAAVAEPLAVALHALGRAGDVVGRRLLVTGAGPIGCLLVAAARLRGAAEIVVTDLTDTALAAAAAVGATTTLRGDEDGLLPEDIDVAVEASGSGSGLTTCLQAVRRGGTVVQLGLLPPGPTPLLGNVLVTREIDLRGAFRFTDEIEDAVQLLAGGSTSIPSSPTCCPSPRRRTRSRSPRTGPGPARSSSTSGDVGRPDRSARHRASRSQNVFVVLSSAYCTVAAPRPGGVGRSVRSSGFSNQ